MPDTPRILIVDDNRDHRRLLIYQLARIGAFDIREAEDGPQGLAALAAALPDLVFMNLRLPLLDGWEVIRRVRALAAPLGQVPIIAFTAYAGGQAEQRARQAGCDAYLVKPLRGTGLLRQVVTALLARGPRP
jgi:two-component system, cell cycle response regulator DivK